MKYILICEDDRAVLTSVEELASETVKVHTVTTLSGLQGMSRNGIVYDFIVLDGFVEDGNTIYYAEMIKRGAYPHLKTSHFVLMSSENKVSHAQSILMSEEVLAADPESPHYTTELGSWLELNPKATVDDAYRAFPELDNEDVWVLHHDFRPRWKHTIVHDKREVPALLKKMMLD